MNRIKKSSFPDPGVFIPIIQYEILIATTLRYSNCGRVKPSEECEKVIREKIKNETNRNTELFALNRRTSTKIETDTGG